MTQRITNRDVAGQLARYAATLAGGGVLGENEAASIRLAAPYGMVTYVLRYVEGRPEHDVPGFTGSGGSGFTSKREAFTRISQAADAVRDVLQYAPEEWDSFTYDRVFRAVLAGAGFTE